MISDTTAMPKDRPRMEIRALAKVYPDGTPALSGIDLDLGEGMFGLLGPNGAGKTTLLSTIVLVQEPSAGSLVYDGLDASRPRDRSAIRRRIGYLPQDFEPLGHLTGLEYVLHCARLRGLPLGRRALRERAREVLSGVDLMRVAGRPSGTYSGGMRRRLGLAQALIHRPRLLVIDEPTAGLDPEERIRFRNLISEVAENAAVLLSTHIVEDIEATCPRIAIIARGRLLYDGEPGALMRQVDGQLWLSPEELPLPASARLLGQRALGSSRSANLYLSSEPAAGAIPFETTLEAAYSAFLAAHGTDVASLRAA
jgi:ABC-type multidrug transport system ATPase subunit